MGRDKALLPHPDGVNLLLRQAHLLRSIGCSELLLAAPPDRPYQVEGARRIDDAAPDCGPLGGLVAGLAAATHPRLLVLAVDLPHIDATLPARLLASSTTQLGAVPLDPHGQPEPLCAVYPIARAEPFRRALREHLLALRPLLSLGLTEGWMIGLRADKKLLTNWNTPADVA